MRLPWGEALERCGLVGARALGCEGLGHSWYGRSRHRALGPGKVHDDKKPEECEQDELRENMMRHHGVVPLQHVLRWGILPGFGGDGIIRRVAVHDRMRSGFRKTLVLPPHPLTRGACAQQEPLDRFSRTQQGCNATVTHPPPAPTPCLQQAPRRFSLPCICDLCHF